MLDLLLIHSTLHSYLSHTWQLVLDNFSEYALYTYFPMLPSIVVFWSFAIVFTLCDLFPSISPIRRWKIQSQSETPNKIISMALNGLFNHFLLLLLSVVLFNETKKMAPAYTVEELPPIHHMVSQIVMFAFIYDFGFYFIHRLMHIPWLYKNVHYLHHSSHIPCVLTQIYFHPFDLALSLLPVILPPIFLNSHIATKTIWNLVLILESMNAHCGYHFPLLPDSRAHDYHHSHPHKAANFGSFFLVWDQIFQTDKPFKEYLKNLETKKNIENVDKEQEETERKNSTQEKEIFENQNIIENHRPNISPNKFVEEKEDEEEEESALVEPHSVKGEGVPVVDEVFSEIQQRPRRRSSDSHY